MTPDCKDTTGIEALQEESEQELWGLYFEEFAQLIRMTLVSPFNNLEEEILFGLEANERGSSSARVESFGDDFIKQMCHQLEGSFLFGDAKEEDSNLIHSLTVTDIGIVGNHECEDTEDTFSDLVDGDPSLTLRNEFPHAVIEDLGIRSSLVM